MRHKFVKNAYVTEIHRFNFWNQTKNKIKIKSKLKHFLQACVINRESIVTHSNRYNFVNTL